MKKILLITTITALLLAIVIFLLFNREGLSTDQAPTQEPNVAITNPMNKEEIQKAIRTSDKTTHCLLTKNNHTSEYYINGENVFIKNSDRTNDNVVTNYDLKTNNEVYSWNSLTDAGTTFTIPTTEQIKRKPSLIEYQKITPNSYNFDAEGIADLEDMGYKVECESLENDSNIFEPPDISFSYLKLDTLISPDTKPEF